MTKTKLLEELRTLRAIALRAIDAAAGEDRCQVAIDLDVIKFAIDKLQLQLEKDHQPCERCGWKVSIRRRP